MPDCVHLSRDMVRIDAGGSTCCGNTVDVRRCLSSEQPSEYCVHNRDFDGLLNGLSNTGDEVFRVSAVSCLRCEFKSVPILNKRHTAANEYISPTKKMWMDIQSIGQKGLNSKNKALTLDCNSNGYGDVVVAAWIAEGHKNTDTNVLLKASGKRAEFLQLLGQSPVSSGENVVSIGPTWSYDSRTRLTADRLAAWCTVLGLEMIWKKPPVLIGDESRNRINSRIENNKKLVVFCPRSTHTHREWPLAYWSDLYQMLVKMNCQVMVWGDDTLIDDAEPIGISWEDCAACVERASLVVGIDSAPIHFSGTVGAKCLAMLGPTTDGVFSHMPNVYCMSTEKRVMPCSGCWMWGEYYQHAACGRTCGSLSAMLPSMVFDKSAELLENA